MHIILLIVIHTQHTHICTHTYGTHTHIHTETYIHTETHRQTHTQTTHTQLIAVYCGSWYTVLLGTLKQKLLKSKTLY